MLDLSLLIIGICGIVAVWFSVMKSVVLYRPTSNILTYSVLGSVRAMFKALSKPLRSYENSDRVLSFMEPLGLLILLLVWFVLLLFSFANVFFYFGHANYIDCVIESGSALTTLGFFKSNQTPNLFLSIFEAANGLILVALQIAYLPALYAAYNRREQTMTLLEARSGAPYWGPAILRLHQIANVKDDLRNFYLSWESWAADLAESHTSYPSLLYFRSPKPERSWVIALLAVLDSANLYLAIDPEHAPIEARMCLRMGVRTLRDVSKVLRIPYSEDPMPYEPIDLSEEDFCGAISMLRDVGFPILREGVEAYKHFQGWRVNYEKMIFAIAKKIVAPRVAWSVPSSIGQTDFKSLPKIINRTPENPQG